MLGRLRRNTLLLRRFSTETEKKPNLIQQLPSYQKALELAVSEKYDESIKQLETSIQEVESVVGKNTNFHLFLYQRLASIHMLQQDFKSVEKRFQ